MGTNRRTGSGLRPEPECVAFTGVFADLRAVARLLQLRARELDPDDAEEIGYLAQLVQNHADQGLQRIELHNGSPSRTAEAPRRR